MAAEVQALDIIVGANLRRRWPDVVWAEVRSKVSSAMTLSLVTSFWRLLNGLVSGDTEAKVFLETISPLWCFRPDLVLPQLEGFFHLG